VSGALKEESMSDNQPISWRSVVYGTPVVAADGTRVGTVHEILGSDEEDIFHGIRVAIPDHHDVMLEAEAVTDLTDSAVSTSLSSAEVEALPPYSDEATYHLASVGWLRKHLGWTRDSKDDEEPG
jgi:uncharacterized protein YrrD